MRLHRFLGDFDLSKELVEIRNLENIKQIKGVLRLGVGDSLILCDGVSRQARVTIQNIEKGLIACRVEEVLENLDPKKRVSLYLSILKKENFELAVQKAVECGVSEIIPVLTTRTIKTKIKEDRLEKIIREASEQCGRISLPTLRAIMNFSLALEDGAKNIEKIIFDSEGKEYQPDKNAPSASIFVGPEGGFTPEEILEGETQGYTRSSLGPLTLRGETAGIIATYRAVSNI